MIPEQLRAFLSGQIDRLQATYPPNRLVALLLVALGLPAAAIGGYVAVWVPKHFPGAPTFTAGQYTGFFLAGVGVVALQAATMAYRFIDGVQKDEQHVTLLADAAVTRDHTEHIEAMRLESAERIALVEKAEDAQHAQELLGIAPAGPEVARSSPAGALSDTLPPLPTDPAPVAPIDPMAAPAAPLEPAQPAAAPQFAEPGHVEPEPQASAPTPPAAAVPPPDRV